MSAPVAYVKKVFQIIKRGGMKEFSHRLKAKLQFHPARRQREYQRFLRATRPTAAVLDKQRHTIFKYNPCFGIVIPLYNTKPEYLQDLLDSFKAQTYPHFKLFMVDASPAKDGKTALTSFMQAEAEQDPRIIYKILKKNDGIAGNTNIAINLAMQDPEITHLALCDHDDYIEQNTLFEYTNILNQDHNIKIIYSDEDVVRFKDDPKATYVMKPDFDPYLLESCNYINHFFVCEKQLLESAKTKTNLYEQPEYDGAQDYDLYLRLAEKALQLDHDLKNQETQKIKNATYTSSTIYHLPKVLYHWRAADNSTARDPHNKIYAYDAARRALGAHFTRQGVRATVEHTNIIGTYQTKYRADTQPLVSVIISHPNNTTNSNQTINSLKAGTYQNLEFITIDQPSDIKNAHGDILLFVHDQLSMLAPGSIAEMVALLERESVGAVGAELLFSSGKIEHAGIVVGLEANSGHIFYCMYPDYTYGNRANCVTSYSATSDACLMVKKALYHQIGGFDISLPHPFCSIDFCLKIRSTGQSVVYTPHAKFQYNHKPPACPKPQDFPQFYQQWSAIYQNGDPYYNNNYSRQHSDCALEDFMV